MKLESYKDHFTKSESKKLEEKGERPKLEEEKAQIMGDREEINEERREDRCERHKIPLRRPINPPLNIQ